MTKIALLDRKERIIDLVLTDKGKELLSKNQLKFEYYAFSDAGIDYSGSLVASSSTGMSTDDYVHKNLSFEADQRTNSMNSNKSVDLQTFLYTIPAGNKVLPEFNVGIDDTQTIPLAREYLIDYLTTYTKRKNRITKPIDVIARATVPTTTRADKIDEYVAAQRTTAFENNLSLGKSVVGMSVTKNSVAMGANRILGVNTGVMATLMEDERQAADVAAALQKAHDIAAGTRPPEAAPSKTMLPISPPQTPSAPVEEFETIPLSSIKKEVEIITGIDRKTINFGLKTSAGEVIARSGFLVEIFESGSDGVLTKVIQENVQDPLNDETIQEGFSSYLTLEIDK